MQYKKCLKIIILITINSILSNACDIYCELCDNSSRCLKCIQNFYYDNNYKRCKPRCNFGYYYYFNASICTPICPSQYYNDDETGTCKLFLLCPFFSDLGMQLFDEFTKSIVQNEYLIASGKNYVKDDYTLKIFNVTTRKYLGYMEGHDSEILMLSILDSNQKLYSISINQMIIWDLQYGQIDRIINFGKLDANIINAEQNVKQQEGKQIYQYYINKGLQPLYIDEDIIVLWKNIKQFGVLLYKLMQTENFNQNNLIFNKYFQLYDIVHTGEIKGFFKPNLHILCSFTDKVIIAWNMLNNKVINKNNSVCSFNQEIIQKIIKINDKLFLIQFLQGLNMSIYDTSLNECFSIDQEQLLQNNNNKAKFIQDIFVYDSNQQIVFLRTKKSIIINKILSNISSDKTKTSYSFKLLKSLDIQNYFISLNPKPYLNLLQSNGTLYLYQINLKIQNSPQLEDIIEIQLLGQYFLNFQQQMYITNIHFLEEKFMSIIVGKELLYVQFDKNDIIQSKLISSQKNIASQLIGHSKQINGILVDITNKYRIITYSDDGSFKIWEMYDEVQNSNQITRLPQGGYLQSGRLIIDQYHPSCDILESINCAQGVISLQQIKNDIILAQYSDNQIIYWKYIPYSVKFFKKFQLSDQSLVILNYHYHKLLEFLVICNRSQVMVFDFDANTIFDQNDNFLRAYIMRCDSTCQFRDMMIKITQRELRTEIIFQLYNQDLKKFEDPFKVRSFKSIFIYGEIFPNNMILFSTVNKFLYGVYYNQTSEYNTNLSSQASYFSHDPLTQKTIAILKNGQVALYNIFKNVGTKYLSNSGVTLNSITIANNPFIFFFYQNNAYSPNNNQILGINSSLENVFYMVFSDYISTLYADTINKKLYIGFQNGKIYHGPYFNFQLTESQTQNQLKNLQYSQKLKSLFYLSFSFKINIKNIYSNDNRTLNEDKQQHKKQIEGYILDDINQKLITFSKEPKTCLFLWDLQNEDAFYQISDDLIQGISRAFLDIKSDLLFGITEYWVDINNYNFEITVWKYSTLERFNIIKMHQEIIGYLKRDQDASMTYQIRELFFIPNKQIIVSLNSYNMISVYDYQINKPYHNQVSINNINKMYFDENYSIFYIKMVDEFKQWITIYSVYFKVIKNITEHTQDIRDILFIYETVVSYDAYKIVIMERSSFKIIKILTSEFPKITNIIVSYQLNIVVAWNNYKTEEIQNQKITIFDLTTEKIIKEIIPIQAFETGFLNIAYLEESTCQLYFTRTSGQLNSYDVCSYQNTGYYTLNYINQDNIFYIPEFNYIVTSNSNNLSITKVESSISFKQKFVSLYSQRNQNFFLNPNEGTTYYADFDSNIWRINNEDFSFEYFKKIDKILFTKIYNSKFYVVDSEAVTQYNERFSKLQTLKEKIVNLYFTSEYLFIQNFDFSLKKVSIENFNSISNFKIECQDNILSFYAFENFYEILIYCSDSYSRYNYKTEVLLYSDMLNSFSFSRFNYNLDALLHVYMNSDIIFYQSFVANMDSLNSAIQFSFVNSNLSSLEIYNLVIDEEQSNLIIQYSDYVIRVFKIITDQSLIIQNIDEIKLIPSPSMTKLLSIIIANDVIQISLPWQVLEYDRKSLYLSSIFSNSKIITSMYAFVPSNFQDFAYILSSDSLQMVDVQTSDILYKFPLVYPILIDHNIIINDKQNIVEIKGVSNGVFFRYKFFLPISDGKIEPELQIKECYFDVGVIDKYYTQKNKMNALQNSLTYLKINLSRAQIQISPTFSIFYEQEMEKYNSKILYEGVIHKDGSLSKLVLENDTFSPEILQEVQLKNYIIDISKIEFMTFNQRTIRVVYQNIVFVGNGNNIVLEFTRKDYVILENIVIDQVQLSGKSILFYFYDCLYVYIKNLTINGVTLKDESKLFVFNKILQLVSVQDLVINYLFVLQDQVASPIISTQNVIKGIFQNLFFDQIYYYSKNNLTNHILASLGNSIFRISNCTYVNSRNIGLLVSKKNYEENQKAYFRSSNSLDLIQIIVYNIQDLKDSLMKLTGFDVSISYSEFHYIECISCTGGVLFLYQINVLQVSYCNFTNNHAKKGSSIGLIEGRGDFYNTRIVFSNFTNNRAESSGGALYFERSDLQFEGNIITKNQALIGGGIRFIGIQPYFVFHILNNPYGKQLNIIIDNKASIHSQNYGSHIFSANLQSNTNLKQLYCNSSELMQQDHCKQKDQQMLRQYEIDEFQSGGSINLKFQFLDIENQPMTFDIEILKTAKYPQDIIDEIQFYLIRANTINSEIKVYGQYITNYQQFNSNDKSFSIKEMQLVSTPLTKNYIFLDFPTIKRVIQRNEYAYKGVFYIKLTVNFRKCVQGEMYVPSSSLFLCGECKLGFYSLLEPSKEHANIQTCTRCPESAVQCQRNEIQLSEGYWRINNQTDMIIKCKNNPTNCNGDEKNGYCKKGHFGPLCEQCDMRGEIWGSKYTTDGKYNCVNCSELQSNFKYMLPSIIIGIFMIIYMVFSVRIAIQISEYIVIGYYLRKMNLLSISKSAFIDTTNMNIKAMMNYMQLAQLVNTFEVDLPQFLKILPEYVGQPVNSFLYTLDCYLNDLSGSIPVVYLRTIWILIMPLLYIAGMGLIYLILILFKVSRHSNSYIISGLVFLIFFMQPNMISQILRVMTCRKIDENKYIEIDVTQLCYTKTHVYYMLCVCIPGLTLWGILLPFFFLRQLSKNKNLLDNALIRIPYGFLYQDYQYKMYYWEFIKSYLKITVVVIHNFYGDPYNNKLVLTMILILLYQVALLKLKPYQMRYFQQCEKRSMEVLILIVTLNIFLYNKPDKVQQQIFYILALGIHNIYQVYLILEVIKAKMTILYSQNIEYIKEKIKKYFPRLANWLELSKQKDMQVFQNWKRIRNEIRNLKQIKIKILERQKQKIFFDESIQKERENNQLVPVSVSQLSVLADNTSTKCNLIYKYMIEKEDINAFWNNSYKHKIQYYI